MRFRLQVWLSVTGTLLCAGALVVAYFRTPKNFDAISMIHCLPPDQATHMYIDVSALRGAGVMGLVAGTKTEEEPDYRRFVEQTGFDYRNDL